MTLSAAFASPSVQAPTAAAVMARYKGVGPGFEALRLGLSGAVFLLHCFVVTLGPAYDDAIWFWVPVRPVLLSLLPMFFALSGFLVAGSALRTRSATQFLWFRVLRIAPALVMEVSLSALLLGPCLTQLGIGEYFASPVFHRYFLNIVGEVQLFLPGVFLDNPTPAVVNQNLWTLRPEFYCYLLMLGLIVSRLIFHRTAYTAGFAVMTVGYAAYLSTRSWGYREHGPLQFHVLVYCFLAGIAAYHWVDRIVISRTVMLLAVAALVLCLQLKPMLIPALMAMTYIVVYVGMQERFKLGFLKGRDYSYGIYLFGFPIQQTVVLALPADLHCWWLVLGIALPITVLFSMLSWHYVEKPTLALKSLFPTPSRRPRAVAFEAIEACEGAKS